MVGKNLPATILLNNPTAAIVTVLARCQKCEGCLSLGNIQSMLYPMSCERRLCISQELLSIYQSHTLSVYRRDCKTLFFSLLKLQQNQTKKKLVGLGHTMDSSINEILTWHKKLYNLSYSYYLLLNTHFCYN